MFKYGEELEADLQREYGIDIAGIYDGTISPRRALNFIHRLSEGSHYVAARRGLPASAGWTTDRYALIGLNERLDWLNYHFLKAHGAKRVSAPEPIQIPGRRKTKKKGADFSAIAKSLLARKGKAGPDGGNS